MNTPVPPPVTLPSPPAPTPGVPNRPLTADEAASISLRLQPNITAARGNILSAQGVTQQARSALFPNIGIGLGYTNVQNLAGGGNLVSGSGSSSGISGNVSLQQLIFDFDHTRNIVRQYQALERAASQNLSAVQQETVFQVKQAFYQYVENLRLITVNEDNVKNRQGQLDIATARLTAGLGLASDVVTAQTSVSSSIQSLIVARNNSDQSRINLALLMGIDPRTPIQPASSAEPQLTSIDVNSYVQSALRQRPEILQAQATVQANQYGVSAARTTNAPVISGTLGLATHGDRFFPQNDSLAIGIGLSFPFFDGGFTAGRVKEARGALLSAQAQLRSAQLNVTSDVSQAYLNLRTAEQRVSEAASEVANAQEGIRIATGRYSAGLGQFLDILNAQQFLYSAQSDQAAADFAVQQARVALSRAIGAPVASR